MDGDTLYPWLIDLALIVTGAFAYRAASFIYRQISEGYARLSLAFAGKVQRGYLTSYVIGALPLAFVNGYLVRQWWVDCVIVGLGTWIGGLALIAVTRRFDPVLQFYLCSLTTLALLLVDAARWIRPLFR